MWWMNSAFGILMCQSMGIDSRMRESRPWNMVSTAGLHIAKHVFSGLWHRRGEPGSRPPKAAT